MTTSPRSLFNLWPRQYIATLIDRQLYALLVVTDSKLKVTRDNTLLLVITGGVTGQLEDFGGKILEDGREVDWRREN